MRVRLALLVHRHLPLPLFPNKCLAWWAWQHAPDPEAPEPVIRWWTNLVLAGKPIPAVPRFGEMRATR